jgi:hypothetical protein
MNIQVDVAGKLAKNGYEKKKCMPEWYNIPGLFQLIKPLIIRLQCF